MAFFGRRAVGGHLNHRNLTPKPLLTLGPSPTADLGCGLCAHHDGQHIGPGQRGGEGSQGLRPTMHQLPCVKPCNIEASAFRLLFLGVPYTIAMTTSENTKYFDSYNMTNLKNHTTRDPGRVMGGQDLRKGLHLARLDSPASSFRIREC